MSSSSKYAKRAKMDLVCIDTVINMGIPHVAEQIFESLGVDDLLQCLKVSKTWKIIAEKILLQNRGRLVDKFMEECQKGNAEIVEVLLTYLNDTELNATYDLRHSTFDFGYSRYMGRDTALFRACKYGDKTVAELLLNQPGIEVDGFDEDERTCLHWSVIRKGFEQVVQKLLSKMAKRTNLDVQLGFMQSQRRMNQ